MLRTPKIELEVQWTWVDLWGIGWRCGELLKRSLLPNIWTACERGMVSSSFQDLLGSQAELVLLDACVFPQCFFVFWVLFCKRACIF